VGKAHVLALSPENARGGDNFILAVHGDNSVAWKDFIPIIREQSTETAEQGILNPDARNDDIFTSFDVSNAEAAFGKFLGSEEMGKSVIDHYLDLVKLKEST
jgi:hypothetical protein